MSLYFDTRLQITAIKEYIQSISVNVFGVFYEFSGGEALREDH